MAEAEQDLCLIQQEKSRVEEQLAAIQQHITIDDRWLRMNQPKTVGYPETVEELLGLQTYLADLYAQVVALQQAADQLALQLEHGQNPTLPFAG